MRQVFPRLTSVGLVSMAQINPFELFGLPVRFEIDLDDLKNRYLAAQAKVHPDKFAGASDAEKRVAQQWSTLINDSYKRLTQDGARGRLICEILGVPINENSSEGISEEFLMEQLERREAISLAKESSDNAELTSLKCEILCERNKLLKEIARALDVDHKPENAVQPLQKIMFLDRQLQDFQ